MNLEREGLSFFFNKFILNDGVIQLLGSYPKITREINTCRRRRVFSTVLFKDNRKAKHWKLPGCIQVKPRPYEFIEHISPSLFLFDTLCLHIFMKCTEIINTYMQYVMIC